MIFYFLSSILPSSFNFYYHYHQLIKSLSPNSSIELLFQLLSPSSSFIKFTTSTLIIPFKLLYFVLLMLIIFYLLNLQNLLQIEVFLFHILILYFHLFLYCHEYVSLVLCYFLYFLMYCFFILRSFFITWWCDF